MAKDTTEYYSGTYYETGDFAVLMADEKKYEAQAGLAAWIRRDIRPDASVFEFGCGPGYNLFRLPSATKEGYDISSKGREFSRRMGLRVFDTPDEIPTGKYDVAICSHVLEHVPDPAATLGLLRSVLKDGGLLDLMLPVERYHTIPASLSSDYDQHLFTWSPQNIVNLLLSCGFQPERMCYLPMAGRTMLWWWFGKYPSVMMCLLKFFHVLLPRRFRELRTIARKVDAK